MTCCFIDATKHCSLKETYYFLQNYLTKPLNNKLCAFFQLCEGNCRVRRKRAEGRYLEKHTKTTVRPSSGIMVSGTISGKGQGKLFTFEPGEKINSDKHTDVTKTHVIPTMKKLKLKHLLQDRAPIHRSKKSRKFLQKNQVNYIWLPACSPDLNPIENVWSLIKSKLDKEAIFTTKELGKRIQFHWRKLKPDYLKKLARSMPKRLAHVIKLKGSMTGY